MDIKNKKICFLGDSITEGHGASDREKTCFVSLFRDAHPEAKVLNYGIGGTRLAFQRVLSAKPRHEQPFYTRIEGMEEGADLVCVFGGTNDYGHGDAPMGKLGDTTPETFYGALYTVSQMLVNKYPAARIVFFTPLHRTNEDTPKQRDDGAWILRDYVNAVRRNAEYFGFPVLDLWSVSGLQPALPVIKETYLPDGLHPNDAGYKRLYEIVEQFVQSL